jgi:hypothetical protein
MAERMRFIAYLLLIEKMRVDYPLEATTSTGSGHKTWL